MGFSVGTGALFILRRVTGDVGTMSHAFRLQALTRDASLFVDLDWGLPGSARIHSDLRSARRT